MKEITYYNTFKNYRTGNMSWPKKHSDMELSQVGDDEIGLITDMKEHLKIVNPAFYYCKDLGILKVNRTTFMEVSIPDIYIFRIRRYSTIEIFFTYPGNALESFRVRLERLLVIPDYLKRQRRRMVIPDIDLDELERPL